MKSNENSHVFSKQHLCDILDDVLGKTLGEADKNNVFEKTKTQPKITGIAGDVVEQSILGYPADSRQEPDLIVDGIKTELKTTGIRMSKKSKNQFEAKEPMSITAVSPETIVNEKFSDSNFWHKLEHLLLVYYLYASDVTVTAADYAKFPIKGYEFYEFNESDKEILKNDWHIVRDFIRELQDKYTDYEAEYPRISSELRSKLLFIDTAPKWPHRPRFRLKRTVVSSIVQEHFGNRLEQLPKKYNSYMEVEKKCHEVTQIYSDKTVANLITHFCIEGKIKNKSIAERIIVRMFDGRAKKLNKIDIFNKIGLIAKTIVLTTQGLRTEDMKLFKLDFDEICNKNIEFEESSFFNYFSEHQMLCILFEEPNSSTPFSENKFIGFKRIVFSDDFIENSVRPVWNKIRRLIFDNALEDIVKIDKKTGKPRKNKNGVIHSAPNFPKSSEGIVFVRGSSTDSSNKPKQINGINMYSQYLWIKGAYIAEKLSQKNYL